MAYLTKYLAGEIKLTVHSEAKWVTIQELLNYDFAPADLPIVGKLVEKMNL